MGDIYESICPEPLTAEDEAIAMALVRNRKGALPADRKVLKVAARIMQLGDKLEKKVNESMKSIQGRVKRVAAPKPPVTSVSHTVTRQDGNTVAARLALAPGLCLLLDDLSNNKPGGKWLTTSAAAFYCMDRTGRNDLDWHSILMENRRNQNDVVAVVNGKRRRGNAARLGELSFLRYGNKVYYRVSDLDAWLAQLPKSILMH